jgi:hypothetical protein
MSDCLQSSICTSLRCHFLRPVYNIIGSLILSHKNIFTNNKMFNISDVPWWMFSGRTFGFRTFNIPDLSSPDLSYSGPFVAGPLEAGLFEAGPFEAGCFVGLSLYTTESVSGYCSVHMQCRLQILRNTSCTNIHKKVTFML